MLLLYPRLVYSNFMRILYASTAIICLCLSPAAQAKTEAITGVEQDFVYDSNPLFSRSDEDSIFGSETKAFVDVSRETPTEFLQGRATLTRGQFDKSDFNSTDSMFDGQYVKNFLRTVLSLKGKIQYDTTRGADVATFGRVNRADRYLSWRLTPKIDYALTPRTQVTLETNIQKNKYDNTALTDYRTISATPSLMRKISPLQTVVTALQLRRYESLENNDQTVDSIGPTLAWIYEYHPQYSIELIGGVLASKFNGYTSIDDDWQYNPTYGLNFKYEGDRHRAKIGVLRTREPFSNGSEYDLTTFSGESRYPTPGIARCD